MKKSKIIIEPATEERVKEFYGDDFKNSMKGYVALLDGKTVGVTGISFESGYILVFADMKESFRPFKRDIVKSLYLLKEIVDKTKAPMFAVAAKEEKMSERLLTILGFIPEGSLNPDGSKIYWRSSQCQA